MNQQTCSPNKLLPALKYITVYKLLPALKYITVYKLLYTSSYWSRMIVNIINDSFTVSQGKTWLHHVIK